jgi:hypothetical protein
MRNTKPPVTQGPSTIPDNSGDGRLHPNIPTPRENFNGRLTSESFTNEAPPRRNRSFAERHGE